LANWREPGKPWPQPFTMLLFRWLIMLLLIGAVVSFAFYAGTGQVRFKNWGLLILKWTLIAAFGFFAVLVLERVA
jgi:hypothetical protein